MSLTVDRTLASNGLIVLGLSIGAWMIFVQPKAREVCALEASITAPAPSTTDVDQGLFDRTVERVKSIKTQVASIRSRNGLMQDSSRLYGQIMDLAAANHVNIQNLQPGTEKPSADAKFNVARIDLTADGGYANVAAFLEAIDGIDGFIRPVALSLTPVRDITRTGVIAQFSCEAVSFRIPEALTSAGGDHDQP